MWGDRFFCLLMFKGAVCRFTEEMLMWGEKSSSTDKLNDQTDLKGQKHSFYCCSVFVCGGPCHLCVSTQCSGTLLSSEDGLFIHWWKKWFYSLVNIVYISHNGPLIHPLHEPSQCVWEPDGLRWFNSTHPDIILLSAYVHTASGRGDVKLIK